jgi:RNase P/RNase MRP subunit p29
MRAFNIVSQDDKIRKILKQNTIFLIKLPNEKTIKIYGCHLMYRPSHRSKLKFKAKDANKFILENIDF